MPSVRVCLRTICLVVATSMKFVRIKACGDAVPGELGTNPRAAAGIEATGITPVLSSSIERGGH